MDPKGVRRVELRGTRRSKSKVSTHWYIFYTLKWSKGPQVVSVDTLGARAFFSTFRGPQSKKVKNPYTKRWFYKQTFAPFFFRNTEFSFILGMVQCLPLNRITLGQHKIDRYIQLTNLFVYCFGSLPVVSDYNKRLNRLSMIQLSGEHYIFHQIFWILNV